MGRRLGRQRLERINGRLVTVPDIGPHPTAGPVVRCRCVWQGVHCPRPATQEDGLCDWCGPRRPEDMRNNPLAMWGPAGEYLGLGGGGPNPYEHQAGQAGIPAEVRPTACWMESPASRPEGED